MGRRPEAPPPAHQPASVAPPHGIEPGPPRARSRAATAEAGQARNADGYAWDDVAELTPGQVEEFMKGCSIETKAGLRVIAEHGPVIHASLLDRAGIDNYGHFQARVTKRTRTVTGNRNAFLFTWDDWQSRENGGTGHYAVSAKTFRSLRIYFNLD
jgi:hypothetical protein